MAAFENVMGYDSLKRELLEIVDIMQNPEVYETLNVSCPSGLLLYGDPGLGKTLIANSFIELSGRPSIICRKNAAEQSFIESITEAFDKAVEMAPSIILLDDMDKFANDDDDHKDSEAYVTIQSCIDEAKGKGVFVLATANNVRKLPKSLIRTGRFDFKIKVDRPSKEDSLKIIEHYLAGKDLDESVDIKSLAALFVGSSCSTLEAVINQAGIIAGYNRKTKITMDELVQGYLQIAHHISKGDLLSQVPVDLNATDGSADVIWHEAAHVAVSEILMPGSVTMVIGVVTKNGYQGFTTTNMEDSNLTHLDRAKTDIMISLASAAAIDILFGRVDFGAESDVGEALIRIDDIVSDLGGFAGLGMRAFSRHNRSHAILERQEIAISNIAELYYQETKELLCQNRAFLEAIAHQLAEKTILTADDIAATRASLA